MNKFEFDKWVDKMTSEYLSYKGRFFTITYKGGRVTVCGDMKTGKCSMARCHPNDKYDYRYGVAIAYARCRGYDIPKLTTYKSLSEMKYGDRFTVNGSSLFDYTFVGENPRKQGYYIVILIYAEGMPCIKEMRGYDEDEYEMVE